MPGKKGGRQSPSLLAPSDMISEKALYEMVRDYLEGSSLFLVNLRVTPGNRIMVFLDGDQGVTIDDCSKLSRHLEGQLDRNQEDFELEVSSVGVGQPLQLLRQYRNNIGRRLAVADHDGKTTKGRLIQVSEEGVTLEKDKPSRGKKKKKEPDADQGNNVFIPFDQVAMAKVQVSFK